MTKEWVFAPRVESDLIDQLLASRGITDRQAFLSPDYSKLHHPSGLLQMDKLIDRLMKAIENKERIAIFGDYDHDGTPAAALLADGIETCGGQVAEAYIPSRDEGYGLNLAVIDHFIDQKIDLLISVDCGITSKAEIDHAVAHGVDCIVVDHHVVQDDKYPDKAIVVNPKQKGDTYPFKELCACGLAFKVVQTLGERTGKISDHQMKWYLDLVAISTICDMVPLVDENRTLVHYGMIVLQQTKRLGLQQLIKVAGLDKKDISTYTVGFGIGPRLNAPGRMERASISYELLVTKNKAEAVELAERLNALNRQRQEELDKVLKEAEQAVEANKLHQKKVILVSGDGWSDGVVGLVAGRLMEKYHRPSIVLAGREDGLAKGSARSLSEFHLVEALQLCETHLVKYGGHAKAAGLTLAKDQLEQFYDKLIEQAEDRLTEEALRPRITVDAVLRSDELTLETARQLERLEPYGLGNPRPILAVKNMMVAEQKTMGADGKHLRLKLLADDGAMIEAVAFSMASRQDECPVDSFIDVVGMLDVNEWQGRQRLQFKVVDFRSSNVNDLVVG